MARDCVPCRGNGRAGFRGVPRRGYRESQYGNHQDQNEGVHVNVCSVERPPIDRGTRDMGVQSDDDGQVMILNQISGNLVISGCWCC